MAPRGISSQTESSQVHGANFSVHIDKLGKLRCAKRKGFLADDEDFFGHFAVLHHGNHSDHITQTSIICGLLALGYDKASYPQTT